MHIATRSGVMISVTTRSGVISVATRSGVMISAATQSGFMIIPISVATRRRVIYLH